MGGTIWGFAVSVLDLPRQESRTAERCFTIALPRAARVLAAVARLHAAYARERILLVSHGGVMRLLLAQARSLPREQLLNVEVGHGALFALTVAADGALKEGH